MQAKLDEVKVELKSMTSYWKPEWKEIVAKWSAKITVSSDILRERLLLPTDNGTVFILAYKLPSESKFCCMGYDMEDAASFRNSSYSYLYKLPINLIFDIFRHFVVAFGGTFSTSVLKEKIQRYYSAGVSHPQWFWMDEESKRHHKIIRDSLPQADQLSFDNWQVVQFQGVQLGGKLLPIHYIDAVLRQLRKYQTAQMIEHHFHCTDTASDQTDKAALAQRLSQMLTYSKIYHETEVVASVQIADSLDCRILTSLTLPLHTSTIDSNGISEQKVTSEREAVKKFTLQEEDWLAALKRFPTKMRELEKLTVTDLHFIISCFLDAEYDRKETLAKVRQLTKLDSTATSFPSAMDDFSNFDPLHLRGLLAESVLSRKLKGYALGKEEILYGAFAAIAPTALTKIAMDYYSIDVD